MKKEEKIEYTFEGKGDGEVVDVEEEDHNTSTTVNENHHQKEKPQKEISENEKEGIEGIAEDLSVSLPKTNLPLPLKLIALFTLIGGLSIGGSAFSDIFNPNGVKFSLYIIRIIGGVGFIAVAYGMIKRKRWSIWLYGLMVNLGLFINPLFSVLPAILVVYLYFQRRYFWPSLLDRLLVDRFAKISSSFNEKRQSK